MEFIVVIVIVAALIPLLFVLVQYNQLVGLRNYIKNSWSNIDTELKRRYDLIPNLVETVKGYAKHESEVLENVTRLRNQCQANEGPIHEQAVDETLLVGALQRMFVVVENYPELKANENFLLLQKELVNTEDRIQAARRFFNGNVRDYNNKCELFPSNLIASMFGFRSQDYFEVDPAVRENPQVKIQ